MDEYISKPFAVGILEMLRLHYQNTDECSEETVRECIKKICNIKTEDVAPVVHGNWVDCMTKTINTVKCSACCTAFQAYYSDYKYCPRCGAKMDLTDD